MTSSARRFNLLRLILILTCGALAVGIWSSSASASAQTLPPRPTTAPTVPVPTAFPALPGSSTVGAIVLHVDPSLAGAWTTVEWQDGRGGWHLVDGWQGKLDGDSQIWWVGGEHFGAGPFRWLVYASKGGALLATSAPFNLPRLPRETIQVDVSLKP